MLPLWAAHRLLAGQYIYHGPLTVTDNSHKYFVVSHFHPPVTGAQQSHVWCVTPCECPHSTLSPRLPSATDTLVTPSRLPSLPLLTPSPQTHLRGSKSSLPLPWEELKPKAALEEGCPQCSKALEHQYVAATTCARTRLPLAARIRSWLPAVPCNSEAFANWCIITTHLHCLYFLGNSTCAFGAVI